MKYCYVGPLTFALTDANFLGFAVRFMGGSRDVTASYYYGDECGGAVVKEVSPGDKHVKKIGRDLATKRAKQMEGFILSHVDTAYTYFKEHENEKIMKIREHEFHLQENEVQIPDSLIREAMGKVYSGRMLQKLKTYLSIRENRKLYEKFVDKFGGALFEV